MWFLPGTLLGLVAAPATYFLAGQAGGGGEITATSPSVVVPLGVVTAMLLGIFTLFLKDSARSDKRTDQITARLVAGVEAELERANKRVGELEVELKAQHLGAVADKEAALVAERTRLEGEINFWRNRANEFETRLLGKGSTP